jgi:hypothetical protein
MRDSIGLVQISELLRPKSSGKRINESVLPAVREPTPDYAAMQRLVATSDIVSKIADDDRKSDSTEG